MSCFRKFAPGWTGKGIGDQWQWQISIGTVHWLVPALGRIAPSAALLKGRFPDEHCFNVHSKNNGYILCMWNCSLLLCFLIFSAFMFMNSFFYPWHRTRELGSICNFLSSSSFDPLPLFKVLYPDSVLILEKVFSACMGFFHVVSMLLSHNEEFCMH